MESRGGIDFAITKQDGMIMYGLAVLKAFHLACFWGSSNFTVGRKMGDQPSNWRLQSRQQRAFNANEYNYERSYIIRTAVKDVKT